MNTSDHTVIDPLTTQAPGPPEEAKEIKEGKLPALSTRSNRWTMLMWDGEDKQYQRREQDLTKKASGRRKRLLKKMTCPASELSLEG